MIHDEVINKDIDYLPVMNIIYQPSILYSTLCRETSYPQKNKQLEPIKRTQ